MGAFTMIAFALGAAAWRAKGPAGFFSPGCGSTSQGTAVMEGVPFFCCEGGHARSAYLMLASFGLYTLQQLTDELRAGDLVDHHVEGALRPADVG